MNKWLTRSSSNWWWFWWRWLNNEIYRSCVWLLNQSENGNLRNERSVNREIKTGDLLECAFWSNWIERELLNLDSYNWIHLYVKVFDSYAADPANESNYISWTSPENTRIIIFFSRDFFNFAPPNKFSRIKYDESHGYDVFTVPLSARIPVGWSLSRAPAR